MPEQMLQKLANSILKVKHDSPLRVGIDGIDAAGKSFLANELATFLTKSGRNGHLHLNGRLSQPKHVRYQRGRYSPEGYYYDSFNYPLVKEVLLEPLGPDGNRRYRTTAFDYKTDRETQSKEWIASDKDILIFEGVFLFRPELVHYRDVKVFERSIFRPVSIARSSAIATCLAIGKQFGKHTAKDTCPVNKFIWNRRAQKPKRIS